MIKATKVIVLFVGRYLIVPLVYLITLDQSFLNRARTKELTVRDYTPHCIVLFLSMFFYLLLTLNLISVNQDKVATLLSDLVKFEGVLMAGSITVSTFVLTSLKNTLREQQDKKDTITNVVGDLKLVNRIIFVSLLISLSFLLLTQFWLPLINNFSISILAFFILWSVVAIDSLIRNVFLFVWVK